MTEEEIKQEVEELKSLIQEIKGNKLQIGEVTLSSASESLKNLKQLAEDILKSRTVKNYLSMSLKKKITYPQGV